MSSDEYLQLLVVRHNPPVDLSAGGFLFYGHHDADEIALRLTFNGNAWM